MYMYVCMYVSIMYVYVCMYVCMHVCMYVCMYYVCMYVCMHACMHVLCMYACMYVCMHVCMYVYMYVCIMYVCIQTGRTRWQLGLRRGSAPHRLLGLWFRIPPLSNLFALSGICRHNFSISYRKNCTFFKLLFSLLWMFTSYNWLQNNHKEFALNNAKH